MFKVHIAKDGKILCHKFIGGLVLSVDFKESFTVGPKGLCKDCIGRRNKYPVPEQPIQTSILIIYKNSLDLAHKAKRLMIVRINRKESKKRA